MLVGSASFRSLQMVPEPTRGTPVANPTRLLTGAFAVVPIFSPYQETIDLKGTILFDREAFHMLHIDPEVLNLLRALAATGTILVTSYGLFRIGRRLWRNLRKWWTRPVEPGE
jgi:hypothetical protein